VNHELRLLTKIIRLLLKMAPDQHNQTIREAAPEYAAVAAIAVPSFENLYWLLTDIPVP
jgi:hypothetical protein